MRGLAPSLSAFLPSVCSQRIGGFWRPQLPALNWSPMVETTPYLAGDDCRSNRETPDDEVLQ
jgi:hypothetical protein